MNIQQLNKELYEEEKSEENKQEKEVEVEKKEKKNLLKLLFSNEKESNNNDTMKTKENQMKGLNYKNEDFPELVRDVNEGKNGNHCKQENEGNYDGKQDNQENIDINNMQTEKKTTTAPIKNNKKGKKKKFVEMNYNLLKKVESSLFDLQNDENLVEEILICDNNLNHKESNLSIKIKNPVNGTGNKKAVPKKK